MSEFLVVWALCMVAACFVITLVVVAVAVRNHVAPEDDPVELAPGVPVACRTSAAAIVTVGDPAAFDAFLAELILTPHVEDVLR